MKITIELEEKNIHNMSLESVNQFFQLVQGMLKDERLSETQDITAKKEPVKRKRQKMEQTEPIRIDPKLEKPEKEKFSEIEAEAKEESVKEEVAPKEPEITKEITFDEFRTKLISLSKKGTPVTTFIKENYHVSKLSDVKSENYAEIIERLEAM